MNVLSLFDGMACGRIALERVGISVTNYYASEIDKPAMKVAKHNWPDIQHVGDVTKVRIPKGQRIDLLIGGSPCQGFSFAGKQLNFDDPRSKLFFEFVRLLKECRRYNPNVKFLLENVDMDLQYQNVISSYLGVPCIKICSSVLSAQRRPRLYWTNISFDYPKPLGIIFEDIYQPFQKDYELTKVYQERFKLFCHDDGSKMIIGTTALPGKIGQRDRVYGIKTAMPTLTATDYKQPKQILENGILRKITPVECERLQTVPDNYTSIVNNTQRYKMLGNGWTVDVIAHIFKGLYNS